MKLLKRKRSKIEAAGAALKVYLRIVLLQATIGPYTGPHEEISPGERPYNRKIEKAGPSACYRNMLWWSIR
jgi:hypothetical protein